MAVYYYEGKKYDTSKAKLFYDTGIYYEMDYVYKRKRRSRYYITEQNIVFLVLSDWELKDVPFIFVYDNQEVVKTVRIVDKNEIEMLMDKDILPEVRKRLGEMFVEVCW